MDARYAGALKAFLSHHPEEQPIDPGAPDPLRDRPADRAEPVARVARGPQPTARDLLPLILAQMPLQPTYRLRPRTPVSPGRPVMNGR
jgi:hypothetical protein